jgi:hypothetical protein
MNDIPKNYNIIWGLEYIIMNEKTFIDNNAEEIIEMMVKCRNTLAAMKAAPR